MDHTVQSCLVRSLSPSTLQSYKSAARYYLAFCPLSEVVLGRFVAFLANKHLSYLCALCFTQIDFGVPDPSLSYFLHLNYMYVLLCIRRLLPQCKRPKCLPISPDTLQRLFRVWSYPPISYNRIMSWAACCMGFFSFLLSGEFICPLQLQFPIIYCQFQMLRWTHIPILLLLLSTCVTARQTSLAWV